ncbi:hypothetical protein MANES_17G019001v8 [Manihot esculenta]|uniref:Uncharacterized protein n=1 Tax=Manihot esculenta TaxID=3983 RepID=A0ACB7G3A8_MANES|nr:hypothetical protein MANES_17G019001v8 [Manihot esculenta]
MHEKLSSALLGRTQVPLKVPEFRLWREGSAAEGAAESALSSLFKVVFYACLSDVLEGFWGVVYELFRVCWHLIRVHLCRIGPEGPRRPSVLAVAESVQRLPEVSRTKLNLLFYEIKCLKHAHASCLYVIG